MSANDLVLTWVLVQIQFCGNVPEQVCAALIDVARGAGGHDNVTVVLAASYEAPKKLTAGPFVWYLTSMKASP